MLIKCHSSRCGVQIPIVRDLYLVENEIWGRAQFFILYDVCAQCGWGTQVALLEYPIMSFVPLRGNWCNTQNTQGKTEHLFAMSAQFFSLFVILGGEIIRKPGSGLYRPAWKGPFSTFLKLVSRTTSWLLRRFKIKPSRKTPKWQRVVPLPSGKSRANWDVDSPFHHLVVSARSWEMLVRLRAMPTKTGQRRWFANITNPSVRISTFDFVGFCRSCNEYYAAKANKTLDPYDRDRIMVSCWLYLCA